METAKGEDSNGVATSPPTINNAAEQIDDEATEARARAELKKSTDESKKHKGIFFDNALQNLATL
jgi:hypothetical protein